MVELVPTDIFDRLPERYQARAREISARVSELRKLMIRCDTSAVADAASRLQGQLRWQPGTDHEAFGREFRAACFDLPEWAVSETTNDFLAGRVDNHTGQYMPTCAEFAKHARSVIHPFLTEMSILRREAAQLLTRAEDEARRNIIAIERMDPNVQARVKSLKECITAGQASISDHRHLGIDADTQTKLDALKKPREPHASKLENTRIVKGRRS